MSRRYRRYSLFNFAIDLIMFFITSGFWLIWIAIREYRMAHA